MAQMVVVDGREQHWQRVLARWQRSGLSVRAFCQQHQLSVPSFYWWRRKLQGRDPDKVNFLPVQVITEEGVSPTVDGSVEIVLSNGRCLRVRPGFDRATLLRVLDLLDQGGPSC
jgi:transposase